MRSWEWERTLPCSRFLNQGCCKKRKAQLTLGGKEIILVKGGGVHFNSSLPHRYTNIGAEKAEILCFISREKDGSK